MQLPSNLSVSQKTKESLLYKSGFLETSQHSEFKSTPIKDHSTINPLKVKKKDQNFLCYYTKAWLVSRDTCHQTNPRTTLFPSTSILCREWPHCKSTDNNDNIKTTTVFSNVDKEMQCPTIQNLCLQMGLSALSKPQLSNMKSLSTGRVLKPSSLLLGVQMNEPEKVFKSRVWNSVESENSSSVNIWDYSDAEDTPTSYWSTLPN
jgi:hypothetical protein